jgi:hypothetical protein
MSAIAFEGELHAGSAERGHSIRTQATNRRKGKSGYQDNAGNIPNLNNNLVCLENACQP